MSAPTSYLDFQATQWTLLGALLDAYFNGQLLEQSDINSTLASLVGEFKGITTPQEVQIVSGVASVEATAKINYIKIDTQGGGLPLDDLDTITVTNSRGLLPLDMFMFGIKSVGRRVNFTSSGNMRVKNTEVRLNDLDSIIVFIVGFGGNLLEIARFPQVDTTDAAPSRSTQYVTSNQVIAETRILDVVALSGETLAEGSITVDTFTHPATIEAWVDIPGEGSFILGSYTSIVTDTDQDVADGLRDSINLGTLFSAISTSPGAITTVTAPVGTGSTANAYTLFSVLTGTITTTDVDFGGVTLGADGTETNGSIDTFVGGTDGGYDVHNAMASATLTLDVTGGNVTGGGNIVMAAGEYVRVLKSGSNFSIPKI